MKVNCSETAVYTVVSKFTMLENFRDKKKTGRPRKKSMRDDSMIKSSMKRSPTNTRKFSKIRCKKVED